MNPNQELIKHFSATGLNKEIKNDFFPFIGYLKSENSTSYSISRHLYFLLMSTAAYYSEIPLIVARPVK